MTLIDSMSDRAIFVLSAAMIFIPLEHLLPRAKGQTLARTGMKIDLSYMLVGGFLIMGLKLLFIAGVVTAFKGVIPDAARSFVHSQPLWLQTILLILAGDFYHYWMHRSAHMIPALWKFHAVHHSIEKMDWIAAHRTHPFDTAVTNSGFIIIAILFDFNPLAALIYSMQFSWHSLLKHSNVKVSWGPLRWILLTPTYHHWHHANQQEAYDKNFAGQLPLWDLLFGTANMEEKHGPARYGVDDPVPRSFLKSLAYPFGLPAGEKPLPAAADD